MIVPLTIDKAIKRAMSTAAPWPTCITCFRSIRSATAPPNSAKIKTEIPAPAPIMPRIKAEDVSS